MQTLDSFFNGILPYVMFLNVLLYIYSAFKIKNIKSLNFLTLYLFLIFINQIIVSYMASIKANNLFLFHAYLVIQFICLSFFYKSLFSRKQNKIVDFLLVTVSILLVIYYFIWPEDFVYFNLPEILITTLPILGYIIMHLYNSLTRKGKYLYFSGGLLVYLSISSLVFLLYSLLADDVDHKILGLQTTKNVATINTVAYFLMQVVIFFEWKLNISKWRTKKV